MDQSGLSYLLLDELSNVLVFHGQRRLRQPTVVEVNPVLTFSMVNCSMACCASRRQRLSWPSRESMRTHQLRWLHFASLHSTNKGESIADQTKYRLPTMSADFI